MVPAASATNFPGYFLSQKNQFANLTSRQTTVTSYSDYWNVPLLPLRPSTS
jgi:hypothetical protein